MQLLCHIGIFSISIKADDEILLVKFSYVRLQNYQASPSKAEINVSFQLYIEILLSYLLCILTKYKSTYASDVQL